MSQLVKNMFGGAERRGYFFKKLLHGFDFFNIDYRFCAGYSLPPKSVCLILSGDCNLQCKMCDIGRSNADKQIAAGSLLVRSLKADSGGMQATDWLQVVDDLAGFAPKPLVLLTGTEPFMFAGWPVVVERIVQRGLPLHITTNGTLLARYAKRLIGLCTAPTALDISVSIDGIGRLHDEIRGVAGTFERAVAGMRAFAAARRERCWSLPALNITCTISNFNYRDLVSFVQWLVRERLPVESVTFNHLWFRDERIAAGHNRRYGETLPVGEENITGVDIGAIDVEVLRGQIREAGRVAAESGLRIGFEPALTDAELRCYYRQPERFVASDRCTAAWRNVSITPAGNIILSPLCFLPPVGNVRRERFRAGWNGGVLRTVRKQLRAAKAYPACARCCMLFGSRPKYHKLKRWIGR